MGYYIILMSLGASYESCVVTATKTQFQKRDRLRGGPRLSKHGNIVDFTRIHLRIALVTGGCRIRFLHELS